MAQRSKRWLAALACVTAATAQARTLPEMAASNGFVICAAPDDMPFSRRDGTPAGLYVDLGRLVASDLGLPLGVRWIPRRELARRVGCDAIMGTAVVKAADPDHITSWRNVPTIPWMRAGAVVVDAGRAPVTTLDALRDRHVAVPSGSWAHRWLDAHGVPVWVRFRTDPEIIDAVVRGDADAGVVSDVAAGWYRQQAGAANLRVLDTLLDGRIRLRRGDRPARHGCRHAGARERHRAIAPGGRRDRGDRQALRRVPAAGRTALAQDSESVRAACTRLQAGSLWPAVAHTRARHCSSPAAL
jgi:polar amino acid transport system substrate-binding protein